MTRVTIVLIAALLCAGCGVKTAYNNLDRLIIWSANDFVDFDKAQSAYLRDELEVLLHWHRTTQLPLYAVGLRKLERDVRNGMDIEALLAVEGMVRSWGEALTQASMPLSAELLYSLSDAQIIELAVGFEESNAEFLEPYEGLDVEARREVWAEEFVDGIKLLAGRLSKDQVRLVDGYRDRYRPDDAAWLDYRRRWQAAVIAALRERQSYERFELAFRDIAGQRERWYGDEYRTLFEHNEAMYRDLTVELIGSLDAKQVSRFSDRLLSIAEDFEQLAGDASAVAPMPACLVTCSDGVAVGASVE
ncbi:MAG: hypothetical protein HC809_12600 [Gammaproteobacteria bacterium]|nr:hypothetical protein [Gammaproteobacteria bacterium]